MNKRPKTLAVTATSEPPQRGRGRPPKPPGELRDKNLRLVIHLLPAERAALEAHAAQRAQPLSVWAREVLLRALRRSTKTE